MISTVITTVHTEELLGSTRHHQIDILIRSGEDLMAKLPWVGISLSWGDLCIAHEVHG